METPYLCPSKGHKHMAAGNRKKHLEFTFARREVCFLLQTFENLDKCFSLYLHCLECGKSPTHFEDTEQLCHSRPPDVTHNENSEN